MDSDSDRTIDSDELEEIIARAKEEQNDNQCQKKTPVKNSVPKIHAISDSESDEEKIEIKKVLVKKKIKNCENDAEATKRKIDNPSPDVNKRKNDYCPDGINKRKIGNPSPEVNRRKNDDYPADINKRKIDNRPKCQYGSKCYRKNPDHRREFYHPGNFSHL